MSTKLFVDGNHVDESIAEKWDLLLQKLKSIKKAAVAFSGGVDSTFLLYAACRALGDNVLAITIQSDWVPMREVSESKAFCSVYGIRQMICQVHRDEVKGFLKNPPDRCYLCKKVLFMRMKELAEAEGFDTMLDGSNLNDISDYRPGMRALKELGIISPLQDAGLTKEEIRILSRAHGLNTWQKPSFACLASRFVYGEEITKEKLDMVDQAEQKLMDLGFRQFRVRIHGKLARIEVLKEEMASLMQPQIRGEIIEYFKKLGFSYITLDLMGYRRGSMNDTMKSK